MKTNYLLIGALFLLTSCQNKISKTEELETPQTVEPISLTMQDFVINSPLEGVEMELPKGWYIEGRDLFNKDSIEVGDSFYGAILPTPRIDCKEFMDRVLNQGEAIETDKDTYDFQWPEDGGDSYINKITLIEKMINGVSVYGAIEDWAGWDEAGEEVQWINCSYCVELAKEKLFLFEFSEDENHSFGYADTLMSTVRLIED